MSSKKRKSDDTKEKEEKQADKPSNGSTEDEEKQQAAKVKKEDDAAEQDKKPKIKSSSKKTSTKKSKSKGRDHKPPGYAVVTAQNSSGRSGLCKVVARLGEDGKDRISDEWLNASPSFLYLNDHGAKGASVQINPDAMDLLDSGALAVLDTVIVDAIMFHHLLEKKGLTTGSTGAVMHPNELSAQGKSLPKPGEYVLKPYSIAMAVQMNENLRTVFGDVKLPDDVRPPTVFDVDGSSIGASKDKKSKDKSPAAALDRVLKEQGISV